MKVWLSLDSNRPLGQRLGDVLAACARSPLLEPRRIRLSSRRHREDLPLEELLKTARQSSRDTCRVDVAAGELLLHWRYGPTGSRPAPALGISGDLALGRKDVDALLWALKELCAVTGAVYATCDLEAVRFARIGQQEIFGPPHAVQALRALYWLNYFGAEYRAYLPITPELREIVTSVEEVGGGGLVVVTRENPTDTVDEERLRRLAQAWPFFRKYDKKAGFEPPVRIDYSAVWSLPAPVGLEPQPIGTTVGPADEFIASVAAHAARFELWALGRNLAVPQTEEDFIRFFQEHEAIIRDELLVPTIAAYGEVVRKKMGGVWSKAVLFNRGEPVVVKPGRPWSARRVILEVLEGLEPIEP